MEKHRGIPGLIKRGKIWHIDKRVRGQRLCQSSGSPEFIEAQRFLIRTLEMHRQATVYGLRPPRTFDQAAAKFIQEHLHKRSLQDDVGHLKKVMPYIGHLHLEAVHRGTLQPFIEARIQEDTVSLVNTFLAFFASPIHLFFDDLCSINNAMVAIAPMSTMDSIKVHTAACFRLRTCEKLSSATRFWTTSIK